VFRFDFSVPICLLSSEGRLNMKLFSVITNLSKFSYTSLVQKRYSIALIAMFSIFCSINLAFSYDRDVTEYVRELFPYDGVKRTFSSNNAVHSIHSNYIVFIANPYKPSYNYTDNYGNFIWYYAAN